jgi:hypothetical protein
VTRLLLKLASDAVEAMIPFLAVRALTPDPKRSRCCSREPLWQVPMNTLPPLRVSEGAESVCLLFCSCQPGCLCSPSHVGDVIAALAAGTLGVPPRLGRRHGSGQTDRQTDSGWTGGTRPVPPFAIAAPCPMPAACGQTDRQTGYVCSRSRQSHRLIVLRLMGQQTDGRTDRQTAADGSAGGGARLQAEQLAVLCEWVLALLKAYSAHNLGVLAVSAAQALREEASADACRDLLALLNLLSQVTQWGGLLMHDAAGAGGGAIDVAQASCFGRRPTERALLLVCASSRCMRHYAMLCTLWRIQPSPAFNHCRGCPAWLCPSTCSC